MIRVVVLICRGGEERRWRRNGIYGVGDVFWRHETAISREPQLDPCARCLETMPVQSRRRRRCLRLVEGGCTEAASSIDSLPYVNPPAREIRQAIKIKARCAHCTHVFDGILQFTRAFSSINYVNNEDLFGS